MTGLNENSEAHMKMEHHTNRVHPNLDRNPIMGPEKNIENKQEHQLEINQEDTLNNNQHRLSENREMKKNQNNKLDWNHEHKHSNQNKNSLYQNAKDDLRATTNCNDDNDTLSELFTFFMSLYENHLNWLHMDVDEDEKLVHDNSKKPQKLAKWFESSSYFETHRHLAYINEESFKAFQEKRASYCSSLTVDIILDAIESLNRFQNEKSPIRVACKKEFTSHQLEFMHSLFADWLIEELMHRFSNIFSLMIFVHHEKFHDLYIRIFKVFTSHSDKICPIWTRRYGKQLFIIAVYSIYRKVIEKSNDRKIDIHNLLRGDDPATFVTQETVIISNLMTTNAHEVGVMLQKLIHLFSDASVNKDQLIYLYSTLVIMLDQIDAIVSLALSTVMKHWESFRKSEFICNLFQGLSTEEDVLQHPLISILLNKVIFLGDSIFPLLYILDSENEIYDTIFLLIVEKLQLFALGNESRIMKQAINDDLGNLESGSIKLISKTISNDMELRIEELLSKLIHDEKWIYILESIGISLGETVAMQILLQMFQTFEFKFPERRKHFFSLVSTYDKFHVHILHSFCRYILWILSQQTGNLTKKTACIVDNLAEFILYLPKYVPHMKLPTYKILLKNWRSLFPLTLLPTDDDNLRIRRTILRLFEILLADKELNMKLYLATDISNGFLSLFFFLLKPGVRTIWAQWNEDEDVGSTMYYRFFTKHDPNIASYRNTISHLLNLLWDRYEIWDESFRYFFELLCSRQMESRLQIQSMMSSEIFEQTNFPLHYHHDVISVLNSYFHQTFPKLSVARDISEKDLQEIIAEDKKEIIEKTATTLFQKLQQSMHVENQLHWKETVNIKKQSTSHLIKSYEATERNTNEIIALIARCFDYTSPFREKKMYSFGNYLVSFTKRHYAPNRDQYTKMIPKKSTFDFDMYIGKLFTKFPIFYEFMKIMSTEPESFLKFSDVICSLWVNLIGEWHSTIHFEKYAGNTDELVHKTKLYLYCLKTAQWIPPPFIYLDEMIHIFNAKEICDALRIIWEYISTHIPTLSQFEGEDGQCSTPIKTRRNHLDEKATKIDEFLNVLRRALENHIEDPSVAEQHFGRVFRHIFAEHNPTRTIDFKNIE